MTGRTAIRVSRKERANFFFYLDCYEHFNKSMGEPWYKPNVFEGRPAGYTALECFAALDSRREVLPCRELGFLLLAVSGKGLLGWHIGQWAEGIQDSLFCVGELQEEYDWFPDWVWASVRGQSGPRKGDWEFPWNVDLLLAEKGLQRTEDRPRQPMSWSFRI